VAGIESVEWMYFLPLLPLFLLLATGLNLFVLPYISRRGGGTSTS
jgi:hypothetical protein